MKTKCSIIYSDKDYITLERPKKFSVTALILWTVLTGGLGLIIYPIIYAGKGNDRITIKKNGDSLG